MKFYSGYRLSNFLIIFGISSIMSCTNFGTDDRKSVQLVLKKDGKTYLFSSLGTMITKIKLDNNESPTLVQTSIVEKDGELYAEPQHIKNIANVLSGNYAIHNYQEKIFDGYISVASHKVYNKKYENDHTEKIGKTTSIANIYLTDLNQTKTHHISWYRSPNQSPIKNCVEMKLWVDKSYKPGERTIAREDYIMIRLSDLVEFYSSNVKLDYVEEENVLYILH